MAVAVALSAGGGGGGRPSRLPLAPARDAELPPQGAQLRARVGQVALRLRQRELTRPRRRGAHLLDLRLERVGPLARTLAQLASLRALSRSRLALGRCSALGCLR